jgi:hypothetical protein
MYPIWSNTFIQLYSNPSPLTQRNHRYLEFCVKRCGYYLQLAVEREELLRALRIESSNCSKLKVLFLSYATLLILRMCMFHKPWVLVNETSIEARPALYYCCSVASTNAIYSCILKELNKDLTQKLEIQTHRLELLTSQRMANENVLAKPTDARSINDATMYADEGDEVSVCHQVSSGR